MGVVDSVFESAAPGASAYAAIGENAWAFQPSSQAEVFRLGADSQGMSSLAAYARETKLVIFHSVSALTAKVLAELPSDVTVMWSGWGGDYYGSSLNPRRGLVAAQTAELLPREFSLGDVRNALRRVFLYEPALQRAAGRADLFSAPVPGDLAHFTARFPQFKGDYHQLSYATIEDSVDVGADSVAPDSVLVGNSATPENNHAEALLRIARQGGRDVRVVVPLSYGDPHYARRVVDLGRELFGSHLAPILEPLPLDAYHRELARCGVVWMGHLRQQGLGNVLRGLWQGAQVVLEQANTIAVYLRSLGLEVVDPSTAEVTRLLAQPPAKDEVQRTRDTMMQVWGRDAIVDSVAALVERAMTR